MSVVSNTRDIIIIIIIISISSIIINKTMNTEKLCHLYTQHVELVTKQSYLPRP